MAYLSDGMGRDRYISANNGGTFRTDPHCSVFVNADKQHDNSIRHFGRGLRNHGQTFSSPVRGLFDGIGTNTNDQSFHFARQNGRAFGLISGPRALLRQRSMLKLQREKAMAQVRSSSRLSQPRQAYGNNQPYSNTYKNLKPWLKSGYQNKTNPREEAKRARNTLNLEATRENIRNQMERSMLRSQSLPQLPPREAQVLINY